MYSFPGLTVKCQVAGYMQLGGRELDIEQLGKYVGSVCLFFSMKVTGGSVLTRILPWGVPGPHLLRNRGPVRTLGGQSYKKHAVRRT